MRINKSWAPLSLVLGVSGCSGESAQSSPSEALEGESGGFEARPGDRDPDADAPDLGLGGDTAAMGGDTGATGGSTGGSTGATGGSTNATGGSTGATGGSSGSSNAVGTQGVTRGQLLFSDDFERTNPLENGWTSGYVNGVWTIDDGVLTGLGDAAHSATLVNRTPWQSGIFEFDVNHGGGGIFGFIANGNGHSFSALFGRGANNGSLIINDTTNGPRTTVDWPSPSEGVWFHVTIIISSDTAEVLLNGESVGVLQSPGIGSVNRTLFQIRNHQDLMTVSFDNFEYWEAIE